MGGNGVETGRRGVLACMAWCGAGVLWTVAGGTPRSLLVGDARAAAATDGLRFVQISDSHVGFNKAANPDVLTTLREAVAKIRALPVRPQFAIHTGDISHLSRDSQFDDADQVIRELGIPVFYVPGEHDLLDEDAGRAYLARYGKGTKGAGWYSFDQSGVHFVGLVNVVNLAAGGMGHLGEEQLRWLEDDLRPLSASAPVVVFAHIPLWSLYPPWGWGTEDGARALGLLRRFGSVTVLNGHIHQVMQKQEGTVAFHTARSTAFPQPAPGTAASPGPMKVPPGALRRVLGVAEVRAVPGQGRLAIVDSVLEAGT